MHYKSAVGSTVRNHPATTWCRSGHSDADPVDICLVGTVHTLVHSGSTSIFLFGSVWVVKGTVGKP